MRIKDFEKFLSEKNDIKHTARVKKRDNYPQMEARQIIVKKILETWNTEIEKSEHTIKDKNSLRAFIENIPTLQLLYFLNLKQLSHMKRKIRLHGFQNEAPS